MKLKKIGMLMILHFFRIFTCFVKRNPNKVTFITLRSNVLENDFKLLYDALSKEKDIELHVILLRFKNTIIGSIQYAYSCIKQLFALSSSSIVLLDHNNFVVSNFKNAGVKVIQVWHASGAVKKFGEERKREYSIHGYDYVICGSKAFIKPYARAFNVCESQVIPCGIPRSDQLYDTCEIEKNSSYMIGKFPQIKGKKVILYAPTFRGSILEKVHTVDIDLDSVLDALGEEYVILYKLHPLLEQKLTCNKGINCEGIDIYTLFSVSDYLISDYSAIIFDYSLLDKPMLFYTPDLEEYENEVGFTISYREEICGPIVRNEQEIIDCIRKNQWDFSKIEQFKNKYCECMDGNSTKRVVELIQTILHSK